MRRRLLKSIIPLLLVSALLLSGCSAAGGRRYTRTWFALDTFVSVTLYGGGEDVLDTCRNICDEYEALFSKTLEGSDLSRINSREDFSVSDDTADILGLARDVMEKTGGSFDITLGGVTSLWDFKSGDKTVPDPDAVTEALSFCGEDSFSIEGNNVTLNNRGVMLDLGGIAKGYIADRLGEYLSGADGVKSAVINLGGNVLCVGRREFTVGIQKPFSENGELAATLAVNGMSVVTSGVYQRYFEKDGTVYHHVLDPKTGFPCDSGLWSATVIGGSSAMCDALATACLVLGKDAGAELIESLDGFSALMITDEGEIIKTAGFEDQAKMI